MATLQLTTSTTADFDQGEVYFIGNATTVIRSGASVAAIHCGLNVYVSPWAR